MPTMVPGKLYEYLDAGRPLVALLPEGEEATDLAVRGGAVLVRPGDRMALAAEIEHRVDGWIATGRAPDRRPAWLDEYTRPRLAARLASELDEVVAARAAGGGR
jgi:hypothetical protein